jgi:hypothetical protein
VVIGVALRYRLVTAVLAIGTSIRGVTTCLRDRPNAFKGFPSGQHARPRTIWSSSEPSRQARPVSCRYRQNRFRRVATPPRVRPHPAKDGSPISSPGCHAHPNVALFRASLQGEVARACSDTTVGATIAPLTGVAMSQLIDSLLLILRNGGTLGFAVATVGFAALIGKKLEVWPGSLIEKDAALWVLLASMAGLAVAAAAIFRGIFRFIQIGHERSKSALARRSRMRSAPNRFDELTAAEKQVILWMAFHDLQSVDASPMEPTISGLVSKCFLIAKSKEAGVGHQVLAANPALLNHFPEIKSQLDATWKASSRDSPPWRSRW